MIILISLFDIVHAESTQFSQPLLPKNFTYIIMNKDLEYTHQHEMSDCSPEQCGGCTGCGEQIEMITVKIEWQHRGSTPYTEQEVQDYICALAQNFVVSHVELVYFNHYFIKDVEDGHSLFLIQGKPLLELVPNAQEMDLITALEKAVFEALR